MSDEPHTSAGRELAAAKDMAKTGYWSPRERISRLTVALSEVTREKEYWRARALAAEASPVHARFVDDGVAYCGYPTGTGVREGCGHVWPCPTVQARE